MLKLVSETLIIQFLHNIPMATTVLYVPDDFDVRTVNKILDDKKVQNLHTDAIADLWGYLSNVTDDMSENLMELSGKKYEVFESLCGKVCEEDTRYKLYGNKKHSPQRIAKKVKRQGLSQKRDSENSSSQYSSSGDTYEVNVNRIENNQDARIPEYEVKAHKDSVDILLFDTGLTICKDYLSGKDNFGRVYEIPKNQILSEFEYDFSLVNYSNMSENNGITKISYTIDTYES